MDANEILKMELERATGLVESLGLFALKMLLTLNAGATVVLLALLGSVIKEGAGFPVHVPQLQGAMLLFLTGIAYVALAIVVTYITAQRKVEIWPDQPDTSLRMHLVLMLLPAFLSFCCFAWGFYRATYAFG
jgi:hypothetical protein